MRNWKGARGKAATATVAGLALLLGGCASPGSGASDAVTGSAEQARDFAAFYEQEIDWHPCTEDEGLDDELAEMLAGAGFDVGAIGCALVRAPYDWEDPSGDEAIELSIVHIPSTGDDPLGVLLGNPGGPGASGTDFMLGTAIAPGFEKVAAHYDLLGFDPRGIGGSTPLDCDGEASTLPVVRLGTCIADHPIAHTMGTSQVARDMELLRHLMGDERMNLLGYSYGTMLGATYATLFPERVGRMVLDSAENAEWASLIHNFDQKVAGAKATVALATACRTEYRDEVEVCPFVDEDSLLEVLSRLDAEPLRASDGTEVTGQTLKDYLTGALYRSHFDRGRILEAIAIALLGSQEAVDWLVATLADDGSVDEFALTIVGCHSFPIEPDIPGLLAHIEEVGMPRLLGGPEITDQTLEPFVDLSCYALPESGLDITDAFDATGADPILVIGITGDHATPYQYAQVLVDELGEATLLTLEDQGHAAAYQGRSTCIDEAVTAYLLEGTMPDPGTVCRGG